MSATAEKIVALSVTQHQFNRIESAWDICSCAGHARVTGEWSTRFDECVASVIGFRPPAHYSLRVNEVREVIEP